MKICSIDECDRVVHAWSMCHPHYIDKKKETAPPCSTEDCDRPTRVRGMCSRHYDKQMRIEAALMENIDYDDFWEFVKKERRIGQPNAKRI